LLLRVVEGYRPDTVAPVLVPSLVAPREAVVVPLSREH